MGGKLLATAEAGYLVTPHADVYWKAAMMCQHYGRAGDPGFPARFKPYVDSLVYTYRLSPVTAALFPAQLGKLERELSGRRRNVALLRRLLRGNPLVRFPDYPAGFRPSHHMLTMSALPGSSGVPRDLLVRALNAEGLGVFPYVPAPIHRWKRLQWRGYAGPVPHWLPNLKRARTDYGAVRLPNAERKVAEGIEMGWNWLRYDPRSMRRIAAVFGKVADNLATLRAHARREHAAGGDPAAVRAAGRVARGYARRR
jgi:dTDP-4-amino-4,6-dideoxygalactose transaminase